MQVLTDAVSQSRANSNIGAARRPSMRTSNQRGGSSRPPTSQRGTIAHVAETDQIAVPVTESVAKPAERIKKGRPLLMVAGVRPLAVSNTVSINRKLCRTLSYSRAFAVKENRK
jgi:hypothetical protein